MFLICFKKYFVYKKIINFCFYCRIINSNGTSVQPEDGEAILVISDTPIYLDNLDDGEDFEFNNNEMFYIDIV